MIAEEQALMPCIDNRFILVSGSLEILVHMNKTEHRVLIIARSKSEEREM